MRGQNCGKQILERVEEEPDISTRLLAAEVGVSQFVVNRRKQGLHPHHDLHDGAPPHFARPVTKWLNNKFLTSGSEETPQYIGLRVHPISIRVIFVL